MSTRLQQIKSIVEAYKSLCVIQVKPKVARQQVNRGLAYEHQFTYQNGDRRWTHPTPRNP